VGPEKMQAAVNERKNLKTTDCIPYELLGMITLIITRR